MIWFIIYMVMALLIVLWVDHCAAMQGVPYNPVAAWIIGVCWPVVCIGLAFVFVHALVRAVFHENQ